MSFDNTHSVVRDIGQGDFGVVRLLREKESGREMAVKMIPASTDDGADRFMLEVQCLALSHPCILRLIGFALPNPGIDRSARIATEYMPGGGLDSALKNAADNNPPPFWSHTGIAIILVGIALGMKFLHSQKIIHRDLKPGMFFSTPTDVLASAILDQRDLCSTTEHQHQTSARPPIGRLR
jgi:mitogen-activated protein kinase 1/3